MRICSACGRQNPDDRDFCDCGEYIRWERTGLVQAAPAPAPPQEAPPPAGGQAPPPPQPQASAAPHAPAQAHAPQQAAPPPPPAPAAPPQPPVEERPPDPATILLRTPEGEPVAGAPLPITVHAGGRARIVALVRNQSRVVDNFDLRIDGLPREWWTATPPMVYLLPYGSGDDYEQEMQIDLHPPHSPDAVAKVWDLQVIVDSRALGAQAASAPVAMEIAPYRDTATQVRPERAKGRRFGSFDVTVTNHANAPALVALEGVDPDGELEFGFNRPPQEIPPGTSITTPMRVRPPRPLWIGRPTDHRFEVVTVTGDEAAQRVTAQPVSADVLSAPQPQTVRRWLTRPPVSPGSYGRKVFRPMTRPPTAGRAVADAYAAAHGAMAGGPPAAAPPRPPNHAVWRQKPYLPWWLIPVVATAILAGGIIYSLLPRNVEVPNVVGMEVFKAQETLEKAELTLGQREKEVIPDKQAGTVVEQSRDAGSNVKKGTAIGVKLAVGTGQVTVPEITKLNVSQADTALRKAGLTLDRQAPDADLTAQIVGQLPKAGEKVPEGTPVQAFLPAKKGAEGDEAAGGGGGGAPGVKKAGAIPFIAAGSSVPAAKAALAKSGITAQETSVLDAAKAGTVAGTNPAPGENVKPGDQVQLLVSAGLPALAYGESGRIFLSRGGEPGKPLTSGARKEAHPVWSPDGKRLAYISGGQIVLKDLESNTNRALTQPGQSYSDLAWAPTPDADVLAMTRQKGENARELCVGRITDSGLDPRCKKDGNLYVSNAIHWGADGRSLLAFGSDQSKNVQGIVQWTSEEPFSPRRGAWSAPKFVAPGNAGKYVIDAVPSPDGKQLAVATNTLSDAFQVYIAAADDFGLAADPKPLGVRGCKIAWRSDGKELSVVDAGSGGGCADANGSITAIDVTQPAKTRAIAPSGNDPAYQPAPAAAGG